MERGGWGSKKDHVKVEGEGGGGAFLAGSKKGGDEKRGVLQSLGELRFAARLLRKEEEKEELIQR